MVSLACDPHCCSPLSLFFTAGIAVRRHRRPPLSSAVAVYGRCYYLCCCCHRCRRRCGMVWSSVLACCCHPFLLSVAPYCRPLLLIVVVHRL